MKAKIVIYGQIMGNRMLLSACQPTEHPCEFEVKKRDFNGYEIIFATKKDAINALSEAYQHLKSDREDWEASIGSYQRADSISYDASRAVITTNLD
jgi:hypothetical protein